MKNIFTALFFVLFAQYAQAEFYIEPYLGYETGTTKGDLDLTTPVVLSVDVDNENTGGRFGSRIGWSTDSWIFGVDYMTGDLEEKLSDGSKETSTHTDIGAFATYRMGKKFTFMLGYVASSVIITDDLDATGSGFRVGFGYAILEHMNINLDYLTTSYKDFDMDGSDGEIDMDRSSTVLSLSFPFEL